KVCDDGGIVYTLDAGRNGRRTKPPDRTRVPLADPSPPDYPDTKWRYMAERFHRDVNLSKLATSLHVRVQALEMLRTGWDPQEKVWTFPHRNSFMRICGIAIRTPRGKKVFYAGGNAGVIAPYNLHRLPDPVYLVEGPTDTAALLSYD